MMNVTIINVAKLIEMEKGNNTQEIERIYFLECKSIQKKNKKR